MFYALLKSSVSPSCSYTLQQHDQRRHTLAMVHIQIFPDRFPLQTEYKMYCIFVRDIYRSLSEFQLENHRKCPFDSMCTTCCSTRLCIFNPSISFIFLEEHEGARCLSPFPSSPPWDPTPLSDARHGWHVPLYPNAGVGWKRCPQMEGSFLGKPNDPSEEFVAMARTKTWCCWNIGARFLGNHPWN